MAFDFPASPANGQVFTPSGGPSYVFQSPVWLANAAASVPSPVGSIIYVPAIIAPDGYLKINGALLSRTTYAPLWTYAQASGNIVTEAVWAAGSQGAFSTGDLATNFRLPDDRGVFIRGLDDSRGIDTGRGISAAQADAYLNHAHTGTYNDHYHGVQSTTAYASGPPGFNSTGATQAQRTVPVRYSGAVEGNLNLNIDASTTGGTETRPRNNARLACIKY